ncbi:MAG: hypothetical protein IJ391_02715 [Clostridia bacterium]|nr:hypothetical protein [Clostridia bacterium]
MSNTSKTNKTTLEAKLEALAKEYKEKLAALEAVGVKEAKKVRKIRDITAEKPDDYVEVRLFRDGDRYRDDVLVGINGYMCRIKRGVPVKIKRCFARLISEAEDSIADINADFLIKDGKMERYC